MTPAHSSPMPVPRWRHRVAVLIGVLITAPAVAWLTFPLWAGLALPYFLPEGWKLVTLETARPGLKSLAVAHIRLEGGVPGFRLGATASGLELRLDGSLVAVETLTLHISPSTSIGAAAEPPGTDEANWIDRYSLPRLVPPGGLPRMEVGRLEWFLAVGVDTQSGVLEDLVFGENADAVQLKTRLDPIPFLNRAGLLTTQLSENAIHLDLLTEGPDARRVFFYRQASQPGETGREAPEALATLQFDFDLAEFDRDSLNALGTHRGLPHLDRASGAFRAGLHFRGRQRLEPVAFSLQAESVELASSESSVSLTWAASGGLDGQSLRLMQERLQLDTTLAHAGLMAHLEAMLESHGIAGLDGESARVVLHSESAWSGRLDLASGTLTEGQGSFGGSAGLGAMNFHFAVDEAALENGMTRLQGRLGLAHDREIRYESPDLQLVLRQLKLEGKATVSLEPGGRIEASGALTQGDSGFLALQADDTLLQGNGFMLSGAFTMGEDSVFSGPLSAVTFRAEEAGAEAPLLLADSLSGTLETRWSAAPAATPASSGELRFDGVRLPAMGLDMDALDVRLESLSLPALDGRLSILTTGMSVPLFEKRTTGFDVDLTTGVAGGAATDGGGELLIGYNAALPFRFRFEPGTNDLVIGLERAALSATALPRLAGTIEPAWAELLKPAGGEIILDGSITWRDGDPAPTGTISVDSDDLDFCIGETCIDDLDLHGQWTLDDAVDGATSISAGLVGLAAGLDMSGFQTQLAVANGERFTLDGLSAVILDGHLEATTIGIDRQQMGDTSVHWTDVDLEQLFRFLDVGGLEGTGRFDAHLPIAGKDGVYTITDGTFQSTGPGRIRYTTGMPATNIGMQALENFAFDSLGGTVDYQANGRYDIRVRLEGRNPDLYGGHPIRFNLNLGGELPALFRALFITGNFGQAILDRVRSGELKEGVN